jgi:hypothetical protein
MPSAKQANEYKTEIQFCFARSSNVELAIINRKK